jgi:hypothetical protein
MVRIGNYALEIKTMAIELRRKSDDTLVKAGDVLTRKDKIDITVKQVLSPSYKYGAAPILAFDGVIYLPSEVGCYATTV